jgi:Holliday junction resolvasome RuvABC endonuclease subunit
MKVLGVDPHSVKPYGWAFIEDGRLVSSGLANIKQLFGLMDSALFGKVDLVAVEDQYLSRNYKVAKELSTSAGKALGAAELLDIPAVSVNVAKWKAAFRCSGGKGSHVHAVSMALCLPCGLGELGDDEASAAGIAWYAWSEAMKKA